jgi:hypothetical protein
LSGALPRAVAAAAKKSPARRSPRAAAPTQSELPFASLQLPIPDRGTLIIMRIDDLAKMQGAVPSAFVHARGNSLQGRWEGEIAAWLEGRARPEQYGVGTHRTPDGRVLSTTTDDILRACPLPKDLALSLRAQQTRVGTVMLNRFGWSKERRRMFGGREQRFCAPFGWGGDAGV